MIAVKQSEDVCNFTFKKSLSVACVVVPAFFVVLVYIFIH